MSTHYEDEAEVEQLRRWWSENWLALAIGLALGLTAIFGWQTWNSRREAAHLEASRLFDELREDLAANKDADATAIAQKLIADHTRSPYAVAAQLTLAKVAVEAKNYDDARDRLQWVARNSKDDGFKDLAKLRLAQVLWQTGKTDDALAQLAGNAPAFNSLYSELRGDILMARSDTKAARDAYQAALSALPNGATNHDELQHKLDALPADAVGAPAVGAHS